ncbi:MAG: YkgJ family cysteine cluster protein [Deltaproteobacteria bacterium]|nr:YkgJ family cysteine cluster protein [Deltaproteobacteria bacterium]
MQCSSGCHDCCHTRLSITVIEATAIVRHLAALPDDQRAAIQRAAKGAIGEGCAALDEQGRCRVYTARPLICRSHGLPIRRREPGRSLPVVDVCFRNFAADGALEKVPESDQLDQDTLSTMSATIDAAFSDAVGAPRGTRIDLAELLADPRQFFE